MVFCNLTLLARDTASKAILCDKCQGSDYLWEAGGEVNYEGWRATDKMRCARTANRVDLEIITDPKRHLNATMLSSAMITTRSIALTESRNALTMPL